MQIATVVTGYAPGRFSAIARRVLAQLEIAVDISIAVVANMSRIDVPVHSGDLRLSCREWRLHSHSVKMGKITYSGPYAVRIHEDLDIIHPLHTWGGQSYSCGGSAKYLEGPQRQLRGATISRLRLACQAS